METRFDEGGLGQAGGGGSRAIGVGPSRTHLHFERRGDRTVLAASSAELPLQVQRPVHGAQGEAVVTLLCPAGALFEGDDVALQVDCGPGADVVLTGTAATKLNRCEGGEIRFAMRVALAAGARFRYLPHELIPLRGADYVQSIDRQLAAGAEAQLLEVVTPGLLREPFAYHRLRLATTVRDERGPVVLERLDLAGAEVREALGTHSHYAGLFLVGPDFDQPAADRAHEALVAAGVHGSASLLARRGLVTKALSHSAIPLREALLAAAATQSGIDGPA